MKNMYKFVKSITILFVMMGVLNGCEENGNSGDSEDDSGNYEYVDLGLPSGLKWATCNVGAENPEDYGDYFAWGETKTKDTYTADNNITNGLQIEDISGDSEYDAAAANWRGDWRMPIWPECEELLEECKWEWIMQGGVYGYRVVGPNGNYIFLPSAGYRDGSSIFYEGECGHYWSSTPDNYEDADRADYLNFDREDCYLNTDKRYRGQSVRPVLGKGIVAPTVTTNEITEIKAHSAECGGNVTDDCGADVISRGVCWSTSSNPTIKDNHTTDGDGMGEFTSHIYGLEPNTTYYVRAYATNAVGTGYGEEVTFTTEPTPIVEYEYVDLGLPSGLKWATFNVGAYYPEDYGDYFAWGEIEPKGEYTDDNSVTDGVEMEDISGNPKYDAATANWGNTWRMPTKEECQELRNECTWQWTTQNGVNGYKVIGPNGNHIFLPAAGYRYGSSLDDVGERGSCWSSTPDRVGDLAYYLYFRSSNDGVYHYAYRSDGRSVRPVLGKGIVAPTVTTNEITEIKAHSAECGGNVTDDCGADVISRGVCWSTSSNPTIKDNHTTDGDGMGEFTSHIYGLEPNTTYYVRAYATNELGTSYGDEKSFTTGESVNHEYVDLGLPSGLKWATCNVGAEKPEDYGDYFAWGEIEPKGEYTDDNSVTDGVEMEDISGNPQYDAATANWGSTWRMPTEEECEELVDECTWQWTTQNGVYGRKVTGPNGNHIFLPAAGSRNGSSLNDAGEYGICWSSTPYSNDYYVYYLGFSSSSYLVSYSNRYRGRSVRPVSE